MTNDENTPPAESKRFCPVDRRTGERLELRIDASIDLPRGRRWTRVVRDLDTGKSYRAWNRSCGLACQCDAYAEELDSMAADRPAPFRAEWCRCEEFPREAVYMPDAVCPCGVRKHHYHCPTCKCVCQVG